MTQDQLDDLAMQAADVVEGTEVVGVVVLIQPAADGSLETIAIAASMPGPVSVEQVRAILLAAGESVVDPELN